MAFGFGRMFNKGRGENYFLLYVFPMFLKSYFEWITNLSSVALSTREINFVNSFELKLVKFAFNRSHLMIDGIQGFEWCNNTIYFKDFGNFVSGTTNVRDKWFSFRGRRIRRRMGPFGSFESSANVFVIIDNIKKNFVRWPISWWKLSLSDNLEAIVISVLRIPIFWVGWWWESTWR